MKKIFTMMFCGAAAFSLMACGSQSADTTTAAETTAAQTTAAETTTAAAKAETLTGSAEGFGGEVKVTLTVEDGKITDCVLEGAGETPEIGGKALEELGKQVVAANGYEIDGVTGATVTSKAAAKAVAAALGEEIEEPETEVKEVESAAPAQIVEIEGGLQIGQVYAAAHGTSCFAEAVAVVQDDVIVAAYIDEFQFMPKDGTVGVPNSDSDFASAYAEGVVLASKRENAEYYSNMMAEKGGSTVALDANYDAIQSFVVGKTIDEVAAVAESDNAVDAVSGATLADTAGYLKAIVDAAKAAKETQAVEYNGNSEDLKLNVAYSAAHGTKCFTEAAALTDGEVLILSYIDEFQFIASGDGIQGVPNSDEKFGENIADGTLLCSKRVNAEYYSKMMAEKGGSTVAIDANYDAIQNHINGMSIADVEALAGEASPVDAISGATLADTAGYIKAVLAAAQK